MAQIKMDVSEYEAMKENKNLLEKSLENERALNEQVKQLTDEKTKALEDAKMKVVKVTRSEVRQHLIMKMEPWGEHAVRRLLNALGINTHAINSDMVLSSWLRDKTRIDWDMLADAFFSKTESVAVPVNEITTHNLDDVKAEIRADIMAGIDNDTKQALAAGEKARAELGELLDKNSELLRTIDILEHVNAELMGLMESGNADSKKCDMVREIVESPDGFFPRRKLKAIRRLFE